MSENKPKATRVTIDLSTSVKPIQVTEEQALEKAKQDNLKQAKFEDENLDVVKTNVDEKLAYEETIQKDDPETKKAMDEANEQLNVKKFHKTNEVLSATDQEKINKDLVRILIIIAIIIFIILLLELPNFIGTFK